MVQTNKLPKQQPRMHQHEVETLHSYGARDLAINGEELVSLSELFMEKGVGTILTCTLCVYHLLQPSQLNFDFTNM